MALAIAQTPKPKYQATEIQQLRLKVKQQEAQIAQKDLFIAQQNFQVTIQNLGVEAAKVITENKWPEDLVLNQQTLEFSDPVPAPKQEGK